MQFTATWIARVTVPLIDWLSLPVELSNLSDSMSVQLKDWLKSQLDRNFEKISTCIAETFEEKLIVLNNKIVERETSLVDLKSALSLSTKRNVVAAFKLVAETRRATAAHEKNAILVAELAATRRELTIAQEQLAAQALAANQQELAAAAIAREIADDVLVEAVPSETCAAEAGSTGDSPTSQIVAAPSLIVEEPGKAPKKRACAGRGKPRIRTNVATELRNRAIAKKLAESGPKCRPRQASASPSSASSHSSSSVSVRSGSALRETVASRERQVQPFKAKPLKPIAWPLPSQCRVETEGRTRLVTKVVPFSAQVNKSTGSRDARYKRFLCSVA